MRSVDPRSRINNHRKHLFGDFCTVGQHETESEGSTMKTKTSEFIVTAKLNELADLLVRTRQEALKECLAIASAWYEGGTAAQVEDEIRALIETPGAL